MTKTLIISELRRRSFFFFFSLVGYVVRKNIKCMFSVCRICRKDADLCKLRTPVAPKEIARVSTARDDSSTLPGLCFYGFCGILPFVTHETLDSLLVKKCSKKLLFQPLSIHPILSVSNTIFGGSETRSFGFKFGFLVSVYSEEYYVFWFPRHFLFISSSR